MIIDNYKYFLFDVDRTLWDFEKNAKAGLQRTIRAFSEFDNLSFEDFYDTYEPYNLELWSKYDKNLITKDFLRIERFRRPIRICLGKDDTAFAEKVGFRYLEEMVKGKELLPGVMEVIKAIQAASAPMAVVTNGFREVQRPKLERSGILHFFKDVIISEEVGINKPDPRIFGIAMEAIGGNKGETLMVGDSYSTDICGAREFGIDQFFLNIKGEIPEIPATYNSPDLMTLIR